LTKTIDVNTMPVAVTPDSKVREWFGGWNSITGVPSSFHVDQDAPLYERDSLASRM